MKKTILMGLIVFFACLSTQAWSTNTPLCVQPKNLTPCNDPNYSTSYCSSDMKCFRDIFPEEAAYPFACCPLGSTDLCDGKCCCSDETCYVLPTKGGISGVCLKPTSATAKGLKTAKTPTKSKTHPKF